MHREPEVLEAEAQVEEWLDCPARITSKELAPVHSVKSGPSRMLVLQVQEWLQIWRKSALMRIARLTNSLAKRSKNGDKSAVAMLKKNDNWVAYSRIWSRRSLHRSCGRAQTCRNQSNV